MRDLRSSQVKKLVQGPEVGADQDQVWSTCLQAPSILLLRSNGRTEKSQRPRWDRGFPGGSDSEESACNVGDLGSIPGLGRSPGEGTTTHSSILAWRIPRTEEPGGLQSMGSQSVSQDWVTFTVTFGGDLGTEAWPGGSSGDTWSHVHGAS